MPYHASRNLFWKLFLPIGVVLLLSALAAALFLPVAIERNAQQDAVDAAQSTVRQFLILRRYYTENVAAKVLAQSDLKVSFDHRGDDKTIPLPATMVHDLSLLLQDSGTSLKLYSPYPFPNRAGRELDSFGQEAWNFLKANPDAAFVRTDLLQGKRTVRVALADRMSAQACVACHNSLPSSPKKDWKLGDVRGVLEVQSSREVASAARVVTMTLATLGAIMLLIAIFLRVFYQRNIARPLHAALDSARSLTASSSEQVAAVQAIAAGDLDATLTPTVLPVIPREALSHDEAGEVLQSVLDMAAVQRSFDQAFASMTEALRASRAAGQARDWLKSGQNDISTLLRGEPELAAMAERILSYLAQRLGASVGILYLLEEDKPRMERVAGYALAADGAYPQSVAAGEGLIGQAMREQRTLCVSDVPPDFLPIASALGKAQPASLLVAPLLHGTNLVGAIELGSFRAFSAQELEFMEMVREALAIGFEVAMARVRLRQLLSNTEQQAEELRVQQEELQQSNEELEERAELLERQREQIRAKNADLEEASRELAARAEQLQKVSAYKTEFMANMSHELRTPLNSMLILASMLKENKSGNLEARQLEYITTIHHAGKDLLDLINDILDLSKVEAGAVEFEYSAVSPQQLCESMLALFQAPATQKALALTATVAPEVPSALHLDSQRVQQILKNLLSNAIKFTSKGGVGLKIRRARADENPLPGPALAFDVSDTGIGVAADKHALIFEAFKQADGSISRSYGGTGLGLSISLQTARKMDGELLLRSEEGKGSTFTLFLPLAQAADAPRSAPPADILPPLPDDRGHLAPGQHSILIVEDDRAFAGVLMDLVHQRGYSALVAHDGESACALASQHLPGGVLLDVKLARSDGWEVMRRLKSEQRTRRIPVHFISGVEQAQQALRMGAIGYMSKPVTREQLDQVFDTLETAMSGPARSLLLVEDNATEASSLAALLSGRGAEVAQAASGAEALQRLGGETFDCVVLDLGLPDMAGGELLSRLRADARWRSLPVIIHSGQELSREQQRELNCIADSVIIKGARSPERLLSEVSLFLHAVEQRREGAAADEDRRLPDKAALGGKTVLIVDDDMRNLFSLTGLLSEQGMLVLEAENGREGLDCLEQHEEVAVVLMDIMMPQMDGYEAMRAIRADARWQALPVIAMTAKAMPDDYQKCLEAGASDYLAKPLDVEQLLSLLRVWCSR
ncbi:response regulator [Massilia sp. NR 4-1]|uniref:response regulator n=1 Tax=Massilia sp. NR 4-1 TaxID=1678028 RepID=UPI00067B8FCE|nr:response regulator [Massilia sp. NR 4-1]